MADIYIAKGVMKTSPLTKTLLAFLVSAYTASAFPLSDLLGSWAGPRTDKEEGEIAGGDRVKINGQKRAQGGVVLIVKGQIGDTAERHQFRKDGGFVVTQGEKKVAYGKWKMKGGKIEIEGKRVDWGDYDLTGSLEMTSADQFKYIWKWGKLGSTSTYKIHRTVPAKSAKSVFTWENP